MFAGDKGVVSMEAEHYFASSAAPETAWTVIPHMGRTLSGVALMPYTQSAEGASLSYKMKIPQKDISRLSPRKLLPESVLLQSPKRFIRSLNTGTTSMIVNISSLLRRVNISNTGIIMIRTGRHLLRPSE